MTEPLTIHIGGAVLDVRSVWLHRGRADCDDAHLNVRLDACPQLEGSVLWAVRTGISCLRRTGKWSIEPTPSNRDKAFIALHRFRTPEEAFQCYRSTCPAGAWVSVDGVLEAKP